MKTILSSFFFLVLISESAYPEDYYKCKYVNLQSYEAIEWILPHAPLWELAKWLRGPFWPSDEMPQGDGYLFVTLPNGQIVLEARYHDLEQQSAIWMDINDMKKETRGGWWHFISSDTGQLLDGTLTELQVEGRMDIRSWEATLQTRNGLFRLYDSRGRLLAEVPYCNGHRNGVMFRWENGLLYGVEIFQDGEATTPFMTLPSRKYFPSYLY